jgi:hypothetical protein
VDAALPITLDCNVYLDSLWAEKKNEETNLKQEKLCTLLPSIIKTQQRGVEANQSELKNKKKDVRERCEKEKKGYKKDLSGLFR